MSTGIYQVEEARQVLRRKTQQLQAIPLDGPDRELEVVHELGALLGKVYEAYVEWETVHVPYRYLEAVWKACEQAEEEIETRMGARRLVSSLKESTGRVGRGRSR